MSYEVREANLEHDRDAILELWRLKNSGDVLSESKLEWCYKTNPVGVGRIFLLYCDGEVSPVGVIGSVFRSFEGGGQSLIGAVMIDFVIHPAHRSLGPGLLLQRMASSTMSESADFAYSYPNRRSSVVRRKSGFVGHQVLPLLVCPINLEPYLRKSVSPLLSKAISFVHHHFLSFVWWICDRRHTVSESLDIDFVSQLAQQTSSKSMCVGNRSYEYLKWRFLEHPSKKIQFSCQSDMSGDPLGYIAYFEAAGGKINVVDYAHGTGVSVLRLFGGFLRSMAGRGKVSVAIEVNKAQGTVLRKFRVLGFQIREKSDVYIMMNTERHSSSILDRLLVTRFDGDN